jgi:hypothetical protein
MVGHLKLKMGLVIGAFFLLAPLSSFAAVQSFRIPTVYSVDLENIIAQEVDKSLGKKVIISIGMADSDTGVGSRNYLEQKLFMDFYIFPTIGEKDRHKILGYDDVMLSKDAFRAAISKYSAGPDTIVLHYTGHGVGEHSIDDPALKYGGIKLSRGELSGRKYLEDYTLASDEYDKFIDGSLEYVPEVCHKYNGSSSCNPEIQTCTLNDYQKLHVLVS